MRLVRVAKALGMTGQQLRRELEQVDFGVKPTDREIPDGLAQGIIRFVARKNNIDVDMEELGFDGDVPAEMEETSAAKQDQAEADQDDDEDGEEEDAEQPKAPVATAEEQSVSLEGVKVMRKLTLEDVPKEAIERERRKLQGQPSRKKADETSKEEGEDKDLPLRKSKRSTVQQQIKKKEGVVELPEQLTVKEFAEKVGVQVPQVVQALMESGIMATINQTIDFDTASIVASELGVEVKKSETTAEVEHLVSRNLEQLLRDEPENLAPRPPIIVVMGHVDHGKTSILDAIRQTDVVGGEAGGITQHIGAYQVHYKPDNGEERRITFLDTPGHEAFTAMRARGAQTTDIAIIVVAADEGIMPTTVEAINHAKEAKVPIVVALNKMDREGADPERVKGELAAQGLQPEDWGGEVPVVPCSAQTKQGISDLIDTILLVADVHDFKANPNRQAVATVIESHLDPSLGSLATVVINAGTLKVGEAFICGQTAGKVRAMIDAHGQRLTDVGLSGAVRISGFDSVPEVGDILQVVRSDQEARVLLEEVQRAHEAQKKRSFADLVSRLSEGKLTQLKVVLKADTQGSLEALQEALAKKITDEVSVKVIHAAIGSVSENDVMMAAASEGVVIAFHVPVSSNVERTAEREGVEVREYDVVYTLLDDIDGLLSGLVEPEEEENILGKLDVKEVFLTKKSEQIVGGRVTEGVIKRLPFRLFRGEEEVGQGRITSLRRVEKDIKEAKEGSDCGMRVETSASIQPGDTMEVYLKELKRKK